MPKIEVEVPVIPFPGGTSQADFYRSAADHLEGGYPVGGSNLTAAVIGLLRATGKALDAAPLAQKCECDHTGNEHMLNGQCCYTTCSCRAFTNTKRDKENNGGLLGDRSLTYFGDGSPEKVFPLDHVKVDPSTPLTPEQMDESKKVHVRFQDLAQRIRDTKRSSQDSEVLYCHVGQHEMCVGFVTGRECPCHCHVSTAANTKRSSEKNDG